MTNNQTAQLQSDYVGSVFVKHARRSQTAPASVNVTTAAISTLLAAQGSGIYSDLSTIVLSVREGSVANVFFGVVVSDGTKTYRFKFLSQDVTTQSPSSPLPVNFDSPIAATNVNTAWTIYLVTNSGSGSPPTPDAVSVDAVANFTLQKAS